jgi:Mn-dependent DtxR family transcriptional regulator
MKLTNKQARLLGHILGFADLGQTPTHKEMALLMGVTGPAITIMLQTLHRKGAVVINRKWRGVIVTAQGLQAFQGIQLSLQLTKQAERLHDRGGINA